MGTITTDGPMIYQIAIVVVAIIIPAVLLVAAIVIEKRFVKKIPWSGDRN